MKRLFADSTVLTLGLLLGWIFGATYQNSVFSSPLFQIAFGIVCGALCAALAGGGILTALDHKRFNEIKRRTRMDFSKDKTTFTIEPK